MAKIWQNFNKYLEKLKLLVIPCFFATETIYQLWSSREVALISLKTRKKEYGFIKKLYRYVMHYHARWMADEGCRTQTEQVVE